MKPQVNTDEHRKEINMFVTMTLLLKDKLRLSVFISGYIKILI